MPFFRFCVSLYTPETARTLKLCQREEIEDRDKQSLREAEVAALSLGERPGVRGKKGPN
jgi:hypothetical protein